VHHLGEVNVDLRQLLTTEFNDTTMLSVHDDDAPTVYINGNPSQTGTVTRIAEQESAQLVAFRSSTTIRWCGSVSPARPRCPSCT
jgi:predicted secreted protein